MALGAVLLNVAKIALVLYFAPAFFFLIVNHSYPLAANVFPKQGQPLFEGEQLRALERNCSQSSKGLEFDLCTRLKHFYNTYPIVGTFLGFVPFLCVRLAFTDVKSLVISVTFSAIVCSLWLAIAISPSEKKSKEQASQEASRAG